MDAVRATNSTVDEFRRVVKQTCTAPASVQTLPTSFLVVSYSRKVVGQTGSGHFSPIGAYDEASDMCLILDTARFKYGPHWVPLELLFEALLPLDPDTGKSRGYMLLGYDGNGEDENDLQHLPLSVLFGSKKSKDFVRKKYKQQLQVLRKQNDVTFDSVLAFWTKNYNGLWELVEPQLQPVEAAEIEMVTAIRDLLKDLIRRNGHSSNPVSNMLPAERECHTSPGVNCCNSSTPNKSGRVLEISPEEVVFVVYLASLPQDARREIVYSRGELGDEIKVDDTAREQTLAEAALISYAIETCDADI